MPLFCHGLDKFSCTPARMITHLSSKSPRCRALSQPPGTTTLGSSWGFADYLQGSQSKQYFQLQIQTDGDGQSGETLHLPGLPATLPASPTQWRAAGRNQEGQDTLLMLTRALITY